MTVTVQPASAAELTDRLLDATNRRDLEALVGCFAPDFTNETPVHPARSFTGRDQVRRNWAQIFAAVPDLRSRIIRRVVDGDTVWTEWEMAGTRRDGSAHLMRGVGIFGAKDGVFGWIRFYMEPVEDGGLDAERAVVVQVAR